MNPITHPDSFVTPMEMLLSTPQDIADLKEVLRRALNTWEVPATHWAVELADLLEAGKVEEVRINYLGRFNEDGKDAP